MQTFLPFPSFVESAKCLDMRRLGKQRVECKQIYLALSGQSEGWKNHPATLMWKGYEVALLKYAYFICEEWTSRGYRDLLCKSFFKREHNKRIADGEYYIAPHWLGDSSFHLSHRSNLLRKNPSHYSKFFPAGTPSDLPYIWPPVEPHQSVYKLN